MELSGIELATSQAHREDDIGSLTAINMTLPELPVMVSFRSALGAKIIVERRPCDSPRSATAVQPRAPRTTPLA